MGDGKRTDGCSLVRVSTQQRETGVHEDEYRKLSRLETKDCNDLIKIEELGFLKVRE